MTAPVSPDSRPPLLVVEDNPETRFLMDRILGRDYEVTTASTPDDALRAMREDTFVAVLLDINLGADRTGVEVMTAARQYPGYDAVPIVACTAYAMPGDAERFLGLGFDGYISKPFTRATLQRALDEATGNAD